MNTIVISSVLSVMILTASAQEKVSEFEREMRDAVMKYRDGKGPEAMTALQKAQSILEKEQTKKVGAVLPPPPADWEDDEMQTADVPAYLGGGKIVKKLYKEKEGQQEVQLEIFYGSSFIKLLQGLTANDDIAKAQGFEIKSAGGEKVLVKELPDKNYELNMPLDGDIMIKLTGKDGTKEDFMMKLIRDVDRRSLKSLVK